MFQVCCEMGLFGTLASAFGVDVYPNHHLRLLVHPFSRQQNHVNVFKECFGMKILLHSFSTCIRCLLFKAHVERLSGE